MKIKFALIYIVAGVAFLAVSLWAFLSNGKSARAIRYKYKLGGIMLTAWAMLSAASCSGVPPFVTCYEPVVECYDVAMPADVVSISVKDKEFMSIRPGEILVITIEAPSYPEYVCRINAAEGDAVLVQSESFSITDNLHSTFQYELELKPGDYRGPAKITVYGKYMDAEGAPHEVLLDGNLPPFTIY